MYTVHGKILQGGCDDTPTSLQVAGVSDLGGLAQRRVLKLDELVPPEMVFTSGVAESMFEILSQGHMLTDLYVDVGDTSSLDLGIRKQVAECCSVYGRDDPIRVLHVYTDGAFAQECQAGAWAIAVCRRDGRWHMLAWVFVSSVQR